MTTPPQRLIWVTDPEPIEGAPEGVREVFVSLVPASHPHALVRLQYVLRNDREVEGPYGVRVQQAPGAPADQWKPVGATLVRDLPFVKLERVARMTLTFGVRAPDGTPLNLSAGIFEMPPSAEKIPARAEEMVRAHHPDVDPDGGPGALRRWKRLIRLAEVQLEYNAAATQGRRHPQRLLQRSAG
ncbi:hypothetical protein QBA35_28980 [Streptomyces bottropensis]|uniref:Uncharacterized protein n=1 Tax=Streptomyces bottropensis TaxID=42235 RepID=A0ABU8AUC4_9ACTN